MDQRELTGDFQEGLRALVTGMLRGLWTALPGIVQSFDPVKMTAVVQVAIQGLQTSPSGKPSWLTPKPLVDVPVIFMSGGGFVLTVPLAADDEVLVVFSSRCIDAWWQNGGVANQPALRMHDRSDGFAIPGPFSQPRTIPNVSVTSAQLRNTDGTAYIELAPGGIVNIVAPGGVNVNGNTKVTGTEEVTGEITANTAGTGIAVGTHRHTGGTISGDTGTPIP